MNIVTLIDNTSKQNILLSEMHDLLKYLQPGLVSSL